MINNIDLFKRLLDFYHISEEQYRSLIRPITREDFLDGHSFNNVDEIVAIVKQSLENHEKIFIYGDYDADGVMSTSILVKTFQKQNYDVSYYLPNRYKDGYGLTMNKCHEIVEKGFGLVICVDNGITCFEQIDYLKANGVKVLVFDHHSVLNNQLPNADGILHPSVSELGETASSAGFVAFIFSINFLGYFDDYLATLAAISLISDMMPLKSYNRNLLRLTFQNYKNQSYLPIDLLKEDEPFDEKTIGLKIAPKINAIGRLIDGDDINRLVEYFTTDDESIIHQYINWISQVNETRKEISKRAIENLDIDSSESVIIQISNEKEGMLGLIANSLLNKYNKPCLVLTLDSTKRFYKGSMRAREGFNVVDALLSLNQYLFAFGGHALAGGCTLEVEKLEDFKKALIEYVNLHPTVVVDNPSIDFKITEINRESYRLIQTLSPFGEGWRAPQLKIKNINPQKLNYSRNLEHIVTSLSMDAKLTGFNFSKATVSQYHDIDLTGVLRLGSYRGYTYIEFLINKINGHQN